MAISIGSLLLVLFCGFFALESMCMRKSLLNAPKRLDRALLTTTMTADPLATADSCPLLDVEIVGSVMLDDFAWLEMHHVVMISTPQSDKVVAIDFSPIDAGAGAVIKNLILNNYVDGELRLRVLDKGDIDSMKKQWSSFNSPDWFSVHTKNTDKASSDDFEASMREIRKLARRDQDMRNIIRLVEILRDKWSLRMNLYTRNCQHFGLFVKSFVRRGDWCEQCALDPSVQRTLASWS